MSAPIVMRIKEETAGKSKLELVVVAIMALLLTMGFLYFGARFR